MAGRTQPAADDQQPGAPPRSTPSTPHRRVKRRGLFDVLFSNSGKPPFDRERFVFKLLAVVILTQLSLYSVATMVCHRVALNDRRQLAEVCPRALDQVAASFDSTLKLLVALLGGAALNRGGK